MARVFLTTRDKESSVSTWQQLEKHNLASVNYPLFKVREVIPDLGNISLCDEIIVTSRNAFKFKDLKFWRHLEKKFLVIGDNLGAYLSLSKGFNFQIFQSSKELCEYVSNNDKRYFYLRGEVISFDFKSVTSNLEEQICYAIDYITPKEQEVMNFLSMHKITDLLFFSKENAAHFLRVISFDKLKNYRIYCLSKRIAEVFSDFDVQIFYPESPNFKDLIKLIKQES